VGWRLARHILGIARDASNLFSWKVVWDECFLTPTRPPPNPTSEILVIIKSFYVGFGGGACDSRRRG